MFRKLRLRLVLVNLSIILLIFLILTAGTYFMVKAKLIEGGDFMMSRLAAELVEGRFENLPPNIAFGPHGRPGALDRPGELSKPGELFRPDEPFKPEHGPVPRLRPELFFVKLNTANEIILNSPFSLLEKDQISFLIAQVLRQEISKGTIWFDQNEYHYLRAALPDQQGAYVIVQDFHQENNFLWQLVTALSIAGFVCMILSLLGSFLMANKAIVPIKRAWQQQKEFIADASHEFRTPLAIIQTNLAVVRDNPDASVLSQDKWLTNIHEETVCMAKLVDSLLFLAQADSHQQFLTKAWIALDRSIVLAAEVFRPLADQRGIRLQLLIQDGVKYFGDESKFRQVINILLDNAIRHTPSGGSIVVRLEHSLKEIILSVSDTGEGMGEEHLENIFDRFYQIDSSRAKGGSGLGLAIAKWIVESHGGSIKAVSKLGLGAVFSVRFPVG